MNADLITDLESIRDKLASLSAEGAAQGFVQCARANIEHAIHEVKDGIFKTPYSERNDFALHPHCACGEPHISQRIIHHYDGQPCCDL